MIDEVPVYVRVAEALGRPADPRMLRDRKLLDALVAKNRITKLGDAGKLERP